MSKEFKKAKKNAKKTATYFIITKPKIPSFSKKMIKEIMKNKKGDQDEG